MSKRVISFLNDSLQNGRRAALVTLVESGEHTPGVPGGMMAVLSDDCCGTVGGGAVEADLIRKCREALAKKDNTGFRFHYDLSADNKLGMVCGGIASGFVTILRPDNRLIIFGGGHVGQKIYEAASVCGFDITVIEDRESYAGQFPDAAFHAVQDFAQSAHELEVDTDTYVVIVTRGHSFDYAVLRALVQKPVAYLGMIGSKNKVSAAFQRLRDEGVPQEYMDKVFAPVGLDIADGSPGEIAIAVLAEILQVKNNGALRHCKDIAK